MRSKRMRAARRSRSVCLPAEGTLGGCAILALGYPRLRLFQVVTSRAYANRRFASHQARSARRCAMKKFYTIEQIADCPFAPPLADAPLAREQAKS
jgi:hypothetical protein